MAFCEKCGAQMNDDAKFCPKCGAPVGGNVTPDASDFAAKVQTFTDTPDTTADYEASDVQQNKVLALFSYLSWLVLIPLFAAKDSPFARFHANQGLVLAIVEIVWGIVYGVLSAILYLIFGLWAFWLYKLLITIFGLVGIVFLVFSIFGIVNAVQGKAKELPIIGKIRLLK